MPRKKKKGSKQDDEEDMDDVVPEECADLQSDVATSTEDIIWENISNLKEKRTSSRIASLNYLINLFQTHQHVEVLYDQERELVSSIMMLTKKASSEDETVLGCRLLALIALTLRAYGLDGHALLLECWGSLQTLMKDPSKPVTARVSATEAVGIMCWCDLVSNTLEESQYSPILAQMDLLLAPESPPMLVKAALDTHCLLLSRAPEDQLAGSLFKRYVMQCVGLLSHPVSEVKESGGFLLALLQEAAMSCEAPDIEVDISEDDVDMEIVIQRLEELAKDSSRRVGKKERAKQKAFFRDILRTVQDCESPTEKMEIFKVEYEFCGWRQILQLRSMRRALGSGLSAQMVKNEILAEVFDVESVAPDDEESATPQQKKAYKISRQNVAKDHFHEREKQRKKKQAMRNDFDGE